MNFWKPGTLTSVFFAAITYNLPGAALTAEELLTLCKEPVTQGYCEGYVAGFYDGRTTSDYGQLALRSCPPSDSTGDRLAVSYTQMVRVFTKWAEKYPEKLHYRDWQAVRESLAQAWPCRPE